MKLDKSEQAWLSSKSARRVVNALGSENARFVGGCVRNAILGEPVHDFDLATTLTPDAVKKALKSEGIAVHDTGLAHGTVTAVTNGVPFEVTTLREDVSTDGRRATVSFTTDWSKDARRRDFTINALYVDGDGQVYDPTGQGLEDIKTRTIRFVGEPETRIIEDYLRILRFFRFNALYNPRGTLDAAALSAIKDNVEGLRTLSAERVWSEIKKILSAPDPARIVNTMALGGILEIILPEASNVEGLQLLTELEQDIALAPDPYLRLMAMSGRDEMAMMRLAKRLKLSNAEKKRFMNWAGDQTPLSDTLSGDELARAVYQAGNQVAMDRALIRAAGAKGAQRDGWLNVYEFARDWERPKFPVTGKDLKPFGLEGPALGKALHALEALWIRSGFKADKDRLLSILPLLQRNQVQ